MTVRKRRIALPWHPPYQGPHLSLVVFLYSVMRGGYVVYRFTESY